MVKVIKKYKLQIVTLILYLVTLAINGDVFINSLKTTGGYLKEMIEILPAVFIMSGLITVWAPRKTITKFLGKDSKIKGNILAMLLGSVSAGPIYAAFPIAFSLFNKGASILNVVILISTWAVIKVPMLLVEAKFLGISFMAVRTLITIPSIFLIGYITKRIVKKEDLLESKENKDFNGKIITAIDVALPHFNCKACGYDSCKEYATSIAINNEKINKCSVGGERVEKEIKEILNKTHEEKKAKPMKT